MVKNVDKNFNNRIQLMIEKTNHLLTFNGIKMIQENDDFSEDELSHEDYVVYTIRNNTSVELRLAFSSGGVDIGINEFYEVHSLAYEEVISDSGQYAEYLSDLFFKAIVIEKCRSMTFYYVRDDNKQSRLIRKVRFGILGVLFPFLPSIPTGCSTVEHSPIYRLS